MRPLSQSSLSLINLSYKLLDHGKHWVADQLRLLSQLVKVHLIDIAMFYYLISGISRNDTKFCLDFG